MAIETTVAVTTMANDERTGAKRTVDLAAIECIERRLEAAHLRPDHAKVSFAPTATNVSVTIEYHRGARRFVVEACAASIRAAANECVSNLLTQMHASEHRSARDDVVR